MSFDSLPGVPFRSVPAGDSVPGFARRSQTRTQTPLVQTDGSLRARGSTLAVLLCLPGPSSARAVSTRGLQSPTGRRRRRRTVSALHFFCCYIQRERKKTEKRGHVSRLFFVGLFVGLFVRTEIVCVCVQQALRDTTTTTTTTYYYY